MSKGWFSVERGLWDHWLKPEKPYSRFEAWLDLIRGANHAPNKFMLKGQLIEVQRGQQARSQVTLAQDWGWSRDKVRRFCKLLEDEGKIIQQNNNLTSIITICNYSEKQGNKTADNTADNTAEKQQTDSKRDTNNNDNNENNEKESSENKFSDQDLITAEYMFKRLQGLDPDFKQPNLNKWADEIRLIRERDKRDHRLICEVFKFANESSFWKGNIQSPTSLRKHFSKLKVQREEQEGKKAEAKKISLPRIDFAFLDWVDANRKKYSLPDAKVGESTSAYRNRVQNHLDNFEGES